MRPVVGADKVARGLTSLLERNRDQSPEMRLGMTNGGISLHVYIDGELDATYMFLGSESHISHVLTMRNPNKLDGVIPRNPCELRIPSASFQVAFSTDCDTTSVEEI